MADTAGPDTTTPPPTEALPTQTQQGRATPAQQAAGAPPPPTPPPAQAPSQGVPTPAPATTDQPPTTQNTPPAPPNPQVQSSAPSQLTPSQGVTTKPVGPVTPVAQSETDKSTPAQGVPAQAPGTATPTAQPTTAADLPAMRVDPRPMIWLQKNNPDLAATVQSAAQEAGITPERLAAHMYVENRFKMADAPTSSAGAVGPMQILPSTAPQVNNGGRLDINNPVDNVRMGANYIRLMDDKFGRDTPASIAAYFGGPGAAQAIKDRPESAMDNYPKTLKYVADITGNNDMKGLSTAIAGATPNSSNPGGLAQAASQGGPDGLLKYLVATRGSQQPLSEAWQAAESSLQRAALWSGSVEGMGQASDAILRMAHQGNNQYLQAASQALSNGDSTSAAGYLAKAHAFFPDNSYGKFGTDSKGNLFAQRMDESSGQPIGAPVAITQQGILAMLNQTTDPNKFAQTLMAEQKSVADARYQNAHADYYTGRNEATETAAAERAAATVEAARVRAAATAGKAPPETPEQKIQQQTTVAAHKEVGNLYSADTDPGTAQVRAREAQVHVAARLGGADPISAEEIARGTAKGDYQPMVDGKGNEAIVDKKGNVKTLLPSGSIKRIFGDVPPAQQPGAGISMGSKPSPLNGAPTLAGAGNPQGTQGIPAAGPPTSPQPTQ